VLASAAAAGAVAYVRLQDTGPATTLPTAQAKQGEFLVLVRCRGEIKARRSRQVTAPANVPDLKIVWQVAPGTLVKKDDVIVRFDPSGAKRSLEEKSAVLRQAQAALDQAVAQARINGEQDRLDLKETSYQVERARLDVAKAEIVSRLQAEESRIDLGMAEQRRSVKQAQVDLNQASEAAKIASLARVRDKAKDEVDLFASRLAQMELKAPSGGLLQFMPNYAQGWMNAKPFKVGDSVWPGAILAELPELESLEMEGKIEEVDRARIAQNQPVRIRVDSLPELALDGAVTELSPMTVMSYEWPPVRTFRAWARMEEPDERLRPSMNGRMDVVIERLPDAISVPAKALFTSHGKPVVYVAGRGAYRPVEVEVIARNPDEIAIKGIAPGTQVLLVEPETKGASKS
jgi:hypothetical protein